MSPAGHRGPTSIAMASLVWRRSALPEPFWARSFHVDASGALYCLATERNAEAGCAIFRQTYDGEWYFDARFDEPVTGGFGVTDDGACFFVANEGTLWAREGGVRAHEGGERTREGSRWARRTLPMRETLCSLWGRSLDDFYLAGEGFVVRFVGGDLHDITPPGFEFQGQGARYAGVHGAGDEVWVVGTNGTHSLALRRMGDEWRPVGCGAYGLSNVRVRPGPEVVAGGTYGAWHYAPAAGFRPLVRRGAPSVETGIAIFEALGWWRSRPLALAYVYDAEPGVALFWGRERVSYQPMPGAPFAPSALFSEGRLVVGAGGGVWQTQLPPP